MKLPLPFLQKKEKPKHFLVLLLREEKAQAILLEEMLGKIKVISKYEAFFNKSIEEVTEEEFLHVLDTAISATEASVNMDFPLHQTVFGVKPNWVESDGKIKKESLGRLKKLSDELGLNPLGFLVIPEAIVHLLKKEEGVPISTILTEIGKKTVTVSLIRAGKLIETKTAYLADSYTKTVDELLKHFTKAEILPSRVTIFNDDVNEEKVTQEFIGHTWSKTLPFLHVPQIATLPHDFGPRSVITASAAQMGFEVLKEYFDSSPIKITEPEEKVSNGEPEESVIATDPSLRSGQAPQSEEIESPLVEPEDSHDFGFMKNADIAKTQKKEPVTEETLEEEIESEETTEQPVQVLEELESSHPQSPKSSKLPQFLSTGLAVLLPILNGTRNLLSHLWHSYAKQVFIHTPRLARKIPRPVLLFLLPLLLLLVGTLSWYFFGLSATVAIEIEPKKLSQTQTVTFTKDKATDFSKNIILAEFVTISQKGEAERAVVGKKEVGEKAKGQVTLFSRFTQERTFSASTTITSSNGLSFTFDDSVKIASAAAGASASPTTTKANVTAKAIGKESNLPSGTKFTVSNFSISDIEAKNDSAFSGGTKKEITAVSKDDIQKLLAELPKSLREKAAEELKKQGGEDKGILPGFFEEEVTGETFDKKEGDEAQNLKLTGTVAFKGIAYDAKEFQEYAKTILADRFPSDLTIYKSVDVEVKKIELKKDGTVEATVDLQALLIPKIDFEKLKGEITGKDFLTAEDQILKLPQVKDVKILLKPNISLLPKTLPQRRENITIETQIHE